MSLATQIGAYAKFTPKQKATTLAILDVPSATLALSSIIIIIGSGVLMLQVQDDINVHVQNL